MKKNNHFGSPEEKAESRSDKAGLNDEILSHLHSLRKQSRRTEKSLRNFYKHVVRPEMKTLEQELASKLPQWMRPGNVGPVEKVTWPFYFTVEVNMGTNPTFGPNTKVSNQFQVSQEAAFMVMAVYQKTFSYSTAGALAPTQVTFRDTQSSRTLNDAPIPLQMVGTRSKPTVLPSPYILMPAAFFQTEVTSWLTAPEATVGDGRIQFTFFGYRMRVVQNADRVLSTAFAVK